MGGVRRDFIRRFFGLLEGSVAVLEVCGCLLEQSDNLLENRHLVLIFRTSLHLIRKSPQQRKAPHPKSEMLPFPQPQSKTSCPRRRRMSRRHRSRQSRPMNRHLRRSRRLRIHRNHRCGILGVLCVGVRLGHRHRQTS